MDAPDRLPLYPLSFTNSPPRQQHTHPTARTAFESKVQTCERDLRPTHQGSMRLKRKSSFEPCQQPKRARYSQNVAYMKLEPDETLETYLYDDAEDNDGGMDFLGGEIDTTLFIMPTPQPKPVPTLVAPAFTSHSLPDIPYRLAQPSQGIHNESGAEYMTKKMFKFSDFTERTKECHKELERIEVEMSSLENQASVLVSYGNTKWLVLRIATLAEERQALRLVLEKSTKGQKRKLERQCRQDREKRHRLEEERLSKKTKLKPEGRNKVPHLSLFNAPRVIPRFIVKVVPSARPETVEAIQKVEVRYAIKQEGSDELMKVKLEEKPSR